MSAQLDLNSFVKILQPESPPKVPKKSYVAPAAGDNEEVRDWVSEIYSTHGDPFFEKKKKKLRSHIISLSSYSSKISAIKWMTSGKKNKKYKIGPVPDTF